MSPKQISLNVRGSEKRRTKTLGGVVSFKNEPENYVSFPKPTIVNLHKNGRNVEVDVKYYVDSGKFSTVPKEARFKASDLCVDEVSFQIGDKVLVREKVATILVPENTVGTIVGGSGDDYRVTFQYSCDGKILEVNQNGVPENSLQFLSNAATDMGESSDEEEEDESEEPEEGDVIPEEGEEMEGEDDDEEEELEGGANEMSEIVEFNMTLPRGLKKYLYEQLNEMLTFQFSEYMDRNEDVTSVTSRDDLDLLLYNYYSTKTSVQL